MGGTGNNDNDDDLNELINNFPNDIDGDITCSDLYPPLPLNCDDDSNKATLRQQMKFHPEWVVGLPSNNENDSTSGLPEDTEGEYLNNPDNRYLYPQEDDWFNHVDLFNTRAIGPEADVWELKVQKRQHEEELRILLRRIATGQGNTTNRNRVAELRWLIRILNLQINGIKEYVGRASRVNLSQDGPEHLSAIDLWTESWRNELYDTKLESMLALQHLDFRREQRIMQIHYERYMEIYHRELDRRLNGLLPQWQPNIPDEESEYW